MVLQVGHMTFDSEWVRNFCQRWAIRRLALFGSALRDDFRPDSDIDLLVTFDPETHWSLWDLGDMEDELVARFGRPVDIVEPGNIVNPIKRKRIFETQQVIYES